MLRPQAVERREIGNPVSHLQRRQPFLGAIRILGGATCMALYHKKKNQRQGKCRRTDIFLLHLCARRTNGLLSAGEAGLLSHR